MNFGIRTDRLDDGVVAIALSGEVDLYTAPRLKEELVGAIDDGAKNVVVDMTDTAFIDSTTLGVLVGGLRRLRPNGGELALVVTDRNIRKIFEITGLDRVFSIHETRDGAVATLAVDA
jgi:anti-sigma B factor antagonist